MLYSGFDRALPRKINWTRVGAVAIPTIAGIILALYLQFMVFGPPKAAVPEPSSVISSARIEINGSNVFLDIDFHNPSPYEMLIVEIRLDNTTSRQLPSPENPLVIPPGSDKDFYLYVGGSSYAKKFGNVENVTITVRYKVGDVFNFTRYIAPVVK